MQQSFNDLYRSLMLEYRHNLADGSSKPSVKATNGKDPNRIDKKNLHTVGPYKPKEGEFHKLGLVMIGDKLLAALASYNMEFREGEVSKIKNSPFGLEMSLNAQGLPMGRVIQIK